MKHAILVSALMAITLSANANPTLEKNGVLTNKEGRTLYTFDKDSDSKSNCSGGCLAAWPAFSVGNPALAGGDFSIIARDDGSKQWAYKGKALYFYAADAKPGDITGDNSGGVWHVIRGGAAKTSAYGSGSAY